MNAATSMCPCGASASGGICDACFARQSAELATKVAERRAVEPVPVPAPATLVRTAPFAQVPPARTCASPSACTGCGRALGEREYGECHACRERQRAERERTERVHAFRRRLPEAYRELPDFDAMELLATRVRDPSGVQRALAARDTATWCTSIIGAAGAGKSHLAIALARVRVYRRRVCGEYIAAADLAYARSRARLGSEPEIVQRALDANVLVLDDLDLAPEVHGSAIVDVIHGRHRANRYTVVTMTLSQTDAAQRFGDGSARRLFERGIATVIALRSKAAP